MKIALVQYAPVWEDKIQSQAAITDLLSSFRVKTPQVKTSQVKTSQVKTSQVKTLQVKTLQVKTLHATSQPTSQPTSNPTSLLVFPELTLTGFTMRSGRFSESDTGETASFFSALAQTYACAVMAGMIESEGDRYYNTLIHWDRTGEIAGKYRKIHPFSFSGENRHYAPGEGPVISHVDGVPCGLSICYDLRFPELYRLYGRDRAAVLINIANWPVGRIAHWHTLLRARAIENQAFVVGVNRVGTDKAYTYPGWSAVFDPLGNELLCYKETSGVAVVDLDIPQVQAVREKFPFLADMRLIR